MKEHKIADFCLRYTSKCIGYFFGCCETWARSCLPNKGRQIDSSFNIRHVCFYGTSGYGKRYEARN